MKSEVDKIKVLVLGMGASAFGREKRAVTTLKNMKRVQPYFLISKWEDGSVSQLLKEAGLEFGFATFGCLGFAKPGWTLITLWHLPKLYYQVFRAYLANRCRTILFLCLHPFINAFPAVLFLKLFCRSRFVFYLGDIPKKTRFHCLVARLAKWLGGEFVANSLAVKRGLASLGIREEKIRVVYNGVDLATYEQTERRDLRREFGWSENSVLIGFVGQINEMKGVTDFIDAARIVSEEEPRCRFLLIGRAVWPWTDLEKELIQRVRKYSLEENVIFAGWQAEMEGVYKALDLVVIPSRHEDPAPNVSIEAMASGIPVVATRVGGISELIEDQVTGILVPKKDVQKIATGILELARNPSLREKMGGEGRKRAKSLFDILKNSRFVEEVLLNGSNNPDL